MSDEETEEYSTSEDISTGQRKEAMEIARNIKIREWDPLKDIPEWSYTTLIYAQRGAGKSHLVKYFVERQKKNFDEVILISGTADLGQSAYSFIHEENKVRDLDPSFIGDLVKTRRELIKRINKGEKIKLNRLLLYMDDCIGDKKFVNSPEFKDLFVLGRHLKINVIVCAQSVGGKDSIPLVVRDNSDLVMVFRIYNQYVRDLVSEQFLSLYDKKIGDALFRVVTDVQYQAIVIARYINDATRYSDYVYRIKAPARLKEFTIGSRKKKPVKIEDYKHDTLRGFEVPKMFIPVLAEDDTGVNEIIY